MASDDPDLLFYEKKLGESLVALVVLTELCLGLVWGS
jgi:hypothetical protein